MDVPPDIMKRVETDPQIGRDLGELTLRKIRIVDITSTGPMDRLYVNTKRISKRPAPEGRTAATRKVIRVLDKIHREATGLEDANLRLMSLGERGSGGIKAFVALPAGVESGTLEEIVTEQMCEGGVQLGYAEAADMSKLVYVRLSPANRSAVEINGKVSHGRAAEIGKEGYDPATGTFRQVLELGGYDLKDPLEQLIFAVGAVALAHPEDLLANREEVATIAGVDKLSSARQ